MKRAERFYKKLSPLLRPFGIPYSLVMKKRRESYLTGKSERYRTCRPTVSVGNIAWGGSGKTPLTAWLLEWAQKSGLHAAVLSRGYGASPGDSPLLVSAGMPPEKVGDEPLLLARAHPEASIVVSPKRAQSAQYAEGALSPDIFILDDGMQHLAVARDCDLILLRPEDICGQWNRVIPGGSWREDASALHAATAFLMKVSPEDLEELTPRITERLTSFGLPFFSFSMKVRRLVPLVERPSGADPAKLIAHPYMLVSGVGNPEQVERTAAAFMRIFSFRSMPFPDHHNYTAKDVEKILAEATRDSQYLPILCTEKDAVKLRPLASSFGTHPVYVMETGLQFGPSLFTEETFRHWWERWWQTHSRTFSGSMPPRQEQNAPE